MHLPSLTIKLGHRPAATGNYCSLFRLTK